jgi:hypothetical protein
MLDPAIDNDTKRVEETEAIKDKKIHAYHIAQKRVEALNERRKANKELLTTSEFRFGTEEGRSPTEDLDKQSIETMTKPELIRDILVFKPKLSRSELNGMPLKDLRSLLRSLE